MWEWKETLYNELKNIPRSKRLAYIRLKAKTAVSEIKKKQASSGAVSKVAEPKPKYGRMK